jgi:hypothetical protein
VCVCECDSDYVGLFIRVQVGNANADALPFFAGLSFVTECAEQLRKGGRETAGPAADRNLQVEKLCSSVLFDNGSLVCMLGKSRCI